MKVTIIGAGIGGLTLGIALKQKGFKVKIYEAAQAFKPVGAGIILGCNAMQVYRALGLEESLKQKGNSLNRLSITDQHLKKLSSISLDYFVEKHEVGNYAIHRADLHQILLDQYEEGEIILNKRLVDLNQAQKGIQFEDGSVEMYEVLIGADGINSRVRKKLFKRQYKIRSAGQMCWRGVLDFQIEGAYRSEFREAWGKGTRVGHGQINEKQVYWFALNNSKESVDFHQSRNWRKDFSHFDPLIKEMFDKTPDEQVYTAPITDLEPLTKWYKHQVCLIGDAAHAMTPNMGQGAGQSIEDAYWLAYYLSHEEMEVNDCLAAFQAYRFKKVNTIVKNSERIGKMAQLNSKLLIGLRNNIMKLTPQSAGIKAMEETFTL